MKVTTREFQLNQKDYLERVAKGETIVLTLYGKDIAYITKDNPLTTINEDHTNLSAAILLDELDKRGLLKKPTGTIPENSTIPKNLESVKIRWCELHFERGVTYECRLISWEDENGEVRVKEKWACPKCYDTYKLKDTGIFYDHTV